LETHCVVSRYELSDFDGAQLLKRVRKSHPNRPFILLTGAGTEQVASEAIQPVLPIICALMPRVSSTLF
jgi:DNA-binding NtrC family response regulator